MSTTTNLYTPSKHSNTTAKARAQERLHEMTGALVTTRMQEFHFTNRRISVGMCERIRELGVSKSELNWIINPRTLSHRKTTKQRLTSEESGRWLRAAKIQALAIEVFGNQEKASKWLHKKREMFDQLSAMELIQTEPGALLVEETLNQIDAGHFA